MSVKLVEKKGKRYIELIPGKMRIENEQDAVDIVGLCGSYQTNSVLLGDGILADHFFDLKSGIAGAILQKFINYRVKIAAIISRERIKGRFGEMVYESQQGSDFRVFPDKESAEVWLLSMYQWPAA
jgi:PadR family transcriptional regulator AphA